MYIRKNVLDENAGFHGTAKPLRRDIRFKVGYDPHRFVADFDNIIEDFQLAGTTFSDPFIATTFLQKLSNIHEPGAVYSSFYHTVTSVAEMKKYEELKLIFIQLDHNSARNNKDKCKMNETSNDTPGKKHRFLSNSVTNTAASTHSTPYLRTPKNKPPKYTSEQYEKLETMTKEEKLKVTCRKCGEYFHDDKNMRSPR